MNRIWWDKRPPHLRDVSGWLDYHLPRIGQALMPIRCRECRRWSWSVHKADCSVARELAARVPIFWRTMAIICGVLAIEVAVIIFVLAPMTPLTPLWWTIFALMFVFSLTAPFTAARFLRDWWMPKR